MPGFGSGSFGSGPFGAFDWSKQVLFKDLPDIDRRLDAAEAENRLEKFTDSIRPSFDTLLRFTRNFGDLRDPDRVRTQFDDKIDVTIVSTAVAIEGRTLDVLILDPAPLPLDGVSLGWVLKDLDGTEFVVNSVHKLRDVGPTVEVVGSAVTPVAGDATLRPATLIGLLGQDYGIEVDFHEPAGFQRSSIRNAVQWLDLKGSEKSYDILGKIAGYRATPFPLWRLSLPIPDALPPGSVFEIPIGSGKFYTELDPVRGFFDEIAADTIPTDLFCFETLDWTSLGIKPPDPSPPDWSQS